MIKVIKRFFRTRYRVREGANGGFYPEYRPFWAPFYAPCFRQGPNATLLDAKMALNNFRRRCKYHYYD